MNSRIINAFKSDTHNIAILVPWKSEVQVFENILKGKVDDFSLYYENKERFPDGCATIKNVHITTFKSAKGLEMSFLCNHLISYILLFQSYF